MHYLVPASSQQNNEMPEPEDSWRWDGDTSLHPRMLPGVGDSSPQMTWTAAKNLTAAPTMTRVFNGGGL